MKFIWFVLFPYIADTFFLYIIVIINILAYSPSAQPT